MIHCDILTLDANCDNDEIMNKEDNCPLVYNTDQINTDETLKNPDELGDGCDDDDDGDTVSDIQDSFPLEECASMDTDKDGAPDSITGTCKDSSLSEDAFPFEKCAQKDKDGDGFPNEINGTCTDTSIMADIDDDHDGLIEITNADMLNNVRYVLDGSGYKESKGSDAIYSGCPEDGCNGYELANDIDLKEIDNWQPIGLVISSSGRVSVLTFSGIFDGNGHLINNLKIHREVSNHRNWILPILLGPLHLLLIFVPTRELPFVAMN